MLFVYVAAVGVAACELMFPGQLRIGTYLDMCLGAYLLQFAIGGMVYYESCTSDDLKHSLLFGTGIGFGFYLVHMLANMGGDLEVLKYGTIFTLFDTDLILAVDRLGYIFMAILAAIGIIFYAMKKYKYMHSVWHFFVLAGSITHFFAVYLYVLK